MSPRTAVAAARKSPTMLNAASLDVERERGGNVVKFIVDENIFHQVADAGLNSSATNTQSSDVRLRFVERIQKWKGI